MTGPEVRVVPLSEVPETAILELLQVCLGPAAVERDAEFWHWKHHANPFGRSPGLVALARDVPVAARVFLRWQWRYGERTLNAVRAVDTATHPDWRRRGLFRRLTGDLLERCRGEGAAFVFNTPNRTSRAGYLRLGWQDVGRVPLLVRPLRSLRMLAALLPGRASTAEPAPPPGRPVEELLAAPELVRFLSSWCGARRLHTPRSAPYLRWRYAESPGVRYGALWRIAEEGGGAVVVTRRRQRRGLSEVSLPEVLVSSDEEGHRRGAELLGSIAASPGVDHIAALAAPGSAERRLLASAGFRAAPFAPRLTVLPLAPPPPDPLDWRAWRPAAGDLELF